MTAVSDLGKESGAELSIVSLSLSRRKKCEMDLIRYKILGDDGKFHGQCQLRFGAGAELS